VIMIIQHITGDPNMGKLTISTPNVDRAIDVLSMIETNDIALRNATADALKALRDVVKQMGETILMR